MNNINEMIFYSDGTVLGGQIYEEYSDSFMIILYFNINNGISPEQVSEQYQQLLTQYLSQAKITYTKGQ